VDVEGSRGLVLPERAMFYMDTALELLEDREMDEAVT